MADEALNAMAEAKRLSLEVSRGLGSTVREIEGNLLDRIEAGDTQALAILYYRMVPLFRTISARYANPGTELFDLMVDTAFPVVDKALKTYDRTLARHETFEVFLRMPLNDHCKATKKREQTRPDRPDVDDRY